MMKWEIIDTGIGTAQGNMDIDKKLLEEVGRNPRPIIHLYEWEGLCATYGYFAKPYDLLNMEGVALHRLQLGRRPTGGGIIFHVCDLAFSVVVPSSHPGFSLNTLDNYALINQAVIRAITRYTGEKLYPSLYSDKPKRQRQTEENFCMAKPTQYDVMVNGCKVGGAAQRKTKDGFLHQGSISLAMPPPDLLRGVLHSESSVFAAMQEVSFTLIEGAVSPKALVDARRAMQLYLTESLTEIG